MKYFMHRDLYLVLLLVVVASGRSAESNPLKNGYERSTSNGGLFGELKYVYQIYKECSGDELSSCLKLKLLTAIDRVSRSVQLNIAEGVVITRDENNSQNININEELPKTPQEIEASLPRALEDKEDALNTMIFDKIIKFFQTHTLKLKLPNVEELSRSLTEEGRGKKKKNMGGLIAIPILIAGTIIPLAIGTLALLAGKALIISKLALVLASIIGLKKLVSGGEHHGHEVVQVGHGGSGWARTGPIGQEMAYSAYKPTTS